MAWHGPLMIPSLFPLGVVMIHFSSLGGLSKIPVAALNSQLVSTIMVLLTFWLYQYVLLLNRVQRGSIFYFLANSLVWGTLVFFNCKNMICFYSMFEFTLLPTFLMIFYYGYQPEKIQACLYLCLYMIMCSLPLLMCVCKMQKSIYFFSFNNNCPVIMITIAFMVKTPVFFLHIWLPKAHVEAPVGGSMILAAILLKLGSYGFLLMGTQIVASNTMMMFLYMSVVGMVLSALSCMRSSDMKSMIAYSSVVHMGVVTGGIVVGSKLSIMTSLMMVVAHGFCSPMMFAAANTIYKSSHSRALVLNKGQFQNSLIGFVVFFVVTANMAVPPSINLWSEMLFIKCLISASFIFFPLMGLSVFLTMAYNIYFYVSTIHGKASVSLKSNYLVDVMSMCSGPLWCYLLFLSVNCLSVI